MALYHLSVGHVSRSTGRSAVQNAAYITGSALYETRRDLSVNFSNRGEDVAWCQTFAPDWAPPEFSDITVWDKLESFEDEYAIERFPNSQEYRDKYMDSARTAMTVVVALPRELSSNVSIELLEEFIETHFTSKGLIVTSAMHDDEGNPHAHLLVSRRSLVLDADGNVQFSWTKNRDMCLKSSLLTLRKDWAHFINAYLEREGFEERVSEKSYVDQGINLTPTKHRGWVSDKLADMGVQSRIVQDNEKVWHENYDKILHEPEIILNEITANQATFTQMQLLKNLHKRLGDNDKNIGLVFEAILQKAIYLGEGMDGVSRYTSTQYQRKEQTAVQTLETFLTSERDHSLKSAPVNVHLNDHYAHLTDEQQAATMGLLKGDSLAVLLGRAGTGKTTTTVKAVCELYAQEGYRVIGGSLSKLATDNLSVETGITAKTIHAWLYCWDKYEDARSKFLSFDNIVDEGMLKQLTWYKDLKSFEKLMPTDKTLFIVDEAGMIGTDQWGRVLAHMNRANAKVIAVGDDAQCKAIEAGDMFREMINQTRGHGSLYELNTIMRQKVDWMRDASQHLATLNTQEALSVYEQHGHIHASDEAYIYEDVARAYCDKLRSNERDDKGNKLYKTGLVLAATNAQTRALNLAIRRAIRLAVLPDHVLSRDVLTVDKGDKATHFAIGDKIVFLKNDKKKITLVDRYGQVIPDRHISNGTTGTLKSVQNNGQVIEVKIDDHTTAHFSLLEYKDIDYGYALTIHKSQGQTVDFVHVLASKGMDAKSMYVALTRHRHDVQMFYSNQEFKTHKEFAQRMSRYDNKDLAIDYTIRPENHDAWHRVQDYLGCVYDAAILYKEVNGESEPDWKPYWALIKIKTQLGKEILNDYAKHEVYMKQTGMTMETLQIGVGQKTRPLSTAEMQAKLTVEIYAETAQAARTLWSQIRIQQNKEAHPHYQAFQDLRDERDSIANDILQNYHLYGEFVKSYTKEYGISKKTLQRQVAYREKANEKQLQQEIKGSFAFNTRVLSQAEHAVIKAFDATHGMESTLPTDHSKESAHSTGKEDQLDNVPVHTVFKTSISSPSFGQTSRPTFDRTSAEIAHELQNNIADLAIHFLGKPTSKTACQWRYGNKGSISVMVNGAKKGMYSNFETGVSGNAVTLIADQLGLDKKEAFKWGVEWLGHDQVIAHGQGQVRSVPFEQNNASGVSSQEADIQTWHPIFPTPKEMPDLKNNSTLRYMMKGRVEVARYPYKDADENILGYVVRLEDKKGTKITPTLTYCQNEQGEHSWRWQGFGNDRPLYGLDQLKQKVDVPVLIVEGEKTCEAARALFPNHAVITWSGGCGSVHKTDWSPLKDRDITILPDHDQAGLNAALKIARILKGQYHVHLEKTVLDKLQDLSEHDKTIPTFNVSIIDIPSTMPHKWDVADTMPNYMTLSQLMSSAKTLDEMAFIAYQKTNPTYSKTFDYKDILDVAKQHDLLDYCAKEKLPMIQYFAQEHFGYQNFLSTILKTNFDQGRPDEQSILAGIYALRAHVVYDGNLRDYKIKDQCLMIGYMAAESKLNGTIYKTETDRIFESGRQYKEHMKKYEAALNNPPESIKNDLKLIQEGLLHAVIQFKIVTKQDMPTHLTRDLYYGVKKLHENPTTHDHAVGIKNTIDYIIEHKANGTYVQHDLTHDKVSLKTQQTHLNINSALQKYHDQMQHIEQQRSLNRGVERTL